MQPAQSELPQILNNGYSGAFKITTNNSSFVSIRDDSGVSSHQYQNDDAA